MPANILKLSPDRALNNLGSVMLGTVKNDGLKVFTDTFVILQSGNPPIPGLALPVILEGCDWATIQVTIIGCKSSPNGMAPIPASGFALPWAAPPPANVITFPPYSPAVLGPNVTVLAPTRLVGLPVAGTPYVVTQPGIIDCMAMPGAVYELLFVVKPLPGVTGLKTYTIPLVSDAGKLADIVVVANLIPGGTPISE